MKLTPRPNLHHLDSLKYGDYQSSCLRINMRVLHTNILKLHKDSLAEPRRQSYAILSHRCDGKGKSIQEIQGFGHVLRYVNDGDSIYWRAEEGPRRLQNCMSTRLSIYRWNDNCCINKESSIKLVEALIRVFRWYRDAQVCNTYLSDVRVSASPLPPRSCQPRVKTTDCKGLFEGLRRRRRGRRRRQLDQHRLSGFRAIGHCRTCGTSRDALLRQRLELRGHQIIFCQRDRKHHPSKGRLLQKHS